MSDKKLKFSVESSQGKSKRKKKINLSSSASFYMTMFSSYFLYMYVYMIQNNLQERSPAMKLTSSSILSKQYSKIGRKENENIIWWKIFSSIHCRIINIQRFCYTRSEMKEEHLLAIKLSHYTTQILLKKMLLI